MTWYVLFKQLNTTTKELKTVQTSVNEGSIDEINSILIMILRNLAQ